MGQYLDLLITRIGEWPPAVVYGFVVISAFLENVVPPVPGDTVVVFTAYLAGRGVLHWMPVYAGTCAGGVVGFLVMYWIGLRGGRSLFRGDSEQGSWTLGRLFSAQRLEQAEGWLKRYGAWLVLGNRFLSGIRSVIAIAAGVGKMNWRSVALLGTLSMVAWNGILLYTGLVIGENWELVGEYLAHYNQIVAAVLALAILAAAARRWRKRSAGSGYIDSSREGP
ncbi:MAG: DedA family protein [Candidatus Latescibacterota bacterium]|nr:DedA family protein [Candidatus Latescibacterota bacterium]